MKQYQAEVQAGENRSILPKDSRRNTEWLPNFGLLLYRIGAGLEQVWSKFGSKLIRIWYEFDGYWSWFRKGEI